MLNALAIKADLSPFDSYAPGRKGLGTVKALLRRNIGISLGRRLVDRRRR